MRTERGRRGFYAAGWLVSAGVMAVTFRMWQLHVREVEQRAEEAVRTKDEAARRRAMEERLRIARELHDSLTHSISVIQVQTGVAVHLARKRGEDVSPALLAIQEAGADAVRELRATLGALRGEEGDGSGLEQLDNLVARARTAGLPVTLTVTGTERPLPPAATTQWRLFNDAKCT
jgi:signal transduction histidine kinase